MQHVDDGCKPPQQFGIALLEFVKRPGLFLEYMKDRFGTVAAPNLGGKWVVAEIFPSLLSVLLQGSMEKCREGGGREGCIGRRGHGIAVEMCGMEGEKVEVKRFYSIDILISRRPCCPPLALACTVDVVPVCAALCHKLPHVDHTLS